MRSSKTRTRWRGVRYVTATAVASLAVAGVAIADNLQSDLDTTTGGHDKTVELGTLSPNTAKSQDVFLYVDETSGATNNPTYPFNVSGSGNLGASFSGVTITGAGTTNGETGQVTWTTPAAQATTQNYTITVTFDADTAINEGPATVVIKFSVAGAPADSTPPVVTPNVSGTLGDNGWYTSNVTVSWSVTDGQSAISSSSGCGSTVISSDTAGTTLTCTATSAGGTNSESVTIKRDATAPTGVSTSLNRLADQSGWYNAPVGWTTSGSDATSGIASCSSGTYSAPDGTGLTVSGSCTDNAGNTSASAQSAAFKFDNTDPTLNPSVSPNPVLLNGSATASANASDATSGVDPSATGCDPVDTSSVGSKSVSCTATDNAGNTNAASASYGVQYGFSGFFQPVDNKILNGMKGGSTAPIKWQLVDANGNYVTSLAAVTRATSGVMACSASAPVDNLEEYATGSTQLRYDTTANQFIYNWQSPKQPGKCYKVVLTFADGTSQSASFTLK